MKGIHPVFHVLLLWKHKTNKIAGGQGESPELVTVDNKEEWEVKEVLDCWKWGRRTEYLVSWKGFGVEENLWEPVENLGNCGDLVTEFDARFPEAESRNQRLWRRN